jgi:hypothetical protein
MRTLLTVIALLLAAGPGGVQAQADAVASPLLLTTMPPPAHAGIVTSMDVGCNERAFEPLAGERLEPQASVLLPLSSAVAVLAQAGVARAPLCGRLGRPGSDHEPRPLYVEHRGAAGRAAQRLRSQDLGSVGMVIAVDAAGAGEKDRG